MDQKKAGDLNLDLEINLNYSNLLYDIWRGFGLMVNPRNWFAEGIATYCLVFFGPLSVMLSVVAFGDGLSTEAILMISFAHYLQD